MEESVYNLIPQAQHDAGLDGTGTQRLLYKSQYSEKVVNDLQKTKSPTRTMGKSYEIDPVDYLKKNQGVPRPQAAPEKRDFISSKPPVPRHDERPLMGMKSDKNYVHDNLVKTVSMQTKKPTPYAIDVPQGSGGRVPLEDSGLLPKYVKKPEYGKVPEYIVEKKHQEEMDRTRRAEATRLANKSPFRAITDAEREALLAGLKENWEKLHREYQGMSLVTDTEVKKIRKTKMEEQLSRLEADIRRLESHASIFVDNY